MSSPDFAKMRPPRKLRSGPKQSGSRGEGAEDAEEDHPNDGGDEGVDTLMEEEEPPSPSGQAALAMRRSPRVAGKNPASDGIESERAAKRQRRNSTESTDAKAQHAPDAAPVKRSPGRPRKHPLPNTEPAATAPAERATASGGRGSAREQERQMQEAASGDGGSAGGVQPARSGSISGVGRPPRQPTLAGAPIRAGPGGSIRPGPGPAGAVRPAVPLLVLQPEQLQRAESGVLSLPPQISSLLSAGSIQVRSAPFIRYTNFQSVRQVVDVWVAIQTDRLCACNCILICQYLCLGFRKLILSAVSLSIFTRGENLVSRLAVILV